MTCRINSLLLFMKRLALAIELEQFPVSCCDVFQAQGSGEGRRSLGGGDSCWKVTRLGMSSGEGAYQDGLGVAGQLAGAACQAHGFRAISKRGVRAGGQQPGEVI